MNWTCSKCGAILTSEMDFHRHICSGSQTSDCPHCKGTGVQVNVGAPNTPCPACGGSGKITY